MLDDHEPFLLRNDTAADAEEWALRLYLSNEQKSKKATAHALHVVNPISIPRTAQSSKHLRVPREPPNNTAS